MPRKSWNNNKNTLKSKHDEQDFTSSPNTPIETRAALGKSDVAYKLFLKSKLHYIFKELQ